MGLLLLVAVAGVSFLSAYLFASHSLWLPAIASSYGAIDRQFAVSFMVLGAVFISVQLALGIFAWKYSRGRQATYSTGNAKLEGLWTVVTAIVFMGFGFGGGRLWADERLTTRAPAPIQIELTGMQFAWYARYPGADQKFGRTRHDLVDPSQGGLSACGVDPTDPVAKDDVVSGTMILPVNREVDLSLRSFDVIHSFFVPEFRVKQDAVPGLITRLRFTPTQIGTYELGCAELCGLGHYRMRASVRVVSQQDFDGWLAQHAERKQ
jgi:cytochrome c oxidase subunit II